MSEEADMSEIKSEIKNVLLAAVRAAEDEWNARECEREAASEAYRVAQQAAQKARSAFSLAKLRANGYDEMGALQLRETIADLARVHAQSAREGHDWAMSDETWRPFRAALDELARRCERSGLGVVGTLSMMGDGAARKYADSQVTPEGCGEVVLVLPRESIQRLGELGLLLKPVYVGPPSPDRPRYVAPWLQETTR